MHFIHTLYRYSIVNNLLYLYLISWYNGAIVIQKFFMGEVLWCAGCAMCSLWFTYSYILSLCMFHTVYIQIREGGCPVLPLYSYCSRQHRLWQTPSLPETCKGQRDWPGPSQGRVSSMRVDSSAGPMSLQEIFITWMYVETQQVHIPLSMGSHDTSTIPAQSIMYWGIDMYWGTW